MLTAEKYVGMIMLIKLQAQDNESDFWHFTYAKHFQNCTALTNLVDPIIVSLN